MPVQTTLWDKRVGAKFMASSNVYDIAVEESITSDVDWLRDEYWDGLAIEPELISVPE